MANKKGSKPKNAVGQKFGRLTIIARAGSNKQRAARWRCQCECGNEIVVEGYRLGKSVSSCGCLRQELVGNKSIKWTGYEDIPGTYWRQIIDNARSRDTPITITIEQAWEVFVRQNGKCTLSGLPLTFHSTSEDGRYRSTHGTASIDRIDNSKGYDLGNIQWVHKDINIMKKDHSQEYFIELCKKVVALVTPKTDNTPNE